MPALDDVQIGHDLEPADDRHGHRRLDEQDILELAVDAVPDPQAVLLGIEMNVGGLTIAGAFQDQVDQLRQSARHGLFLEVFPHIAVMLGAIRGKECRGEHHTASGFRRPRFSVVGSQFAEPLECQLVQQLRRDQIELQDRLAQVAVVFLAVDLRGPNLLRGQQAPLEKNRDQGVSRPG